MQCIFSSTIWGCFKNQNACFDKCFVFQNTPPFYFIFHVILNRHLSGIKRENIESTFFVRINFVLVFFLKIKCW
jgi:hypothetical protein